MLDNLTQAFSMMQSAGVHLTLTPLQVVEHDLKMILGMVWSLIKHYNLRHMQIASEEGSASSKLDPGASAKNGLLAWVNDCTSVLLPGSKIVNFSSCWEDGLGFLALVAKQRPDLVDMSKFSKQTKRENLEYAFSVAEKLGIAKLLDVDDFFSGSPLDEHSVMTYVSEFFNVCQQEKENATAAARANEEAVEKLRKDLEECQLQLEKTRRNEQALLEKLSAVETEREKEKQAMLEQMCNEQRETTELAAGSATAGPLGPASVWISHVNSGTPEEQRALRDLCVQYGQVTAVRFFPQECGAVATFALEADAKAFTWGLTHLADAAKLYVSRVSKSLRVSKDAATPEQWQVLRELCATYGVQFSTDEDGANATVSFTSEEQAAAFAADLHRAENPTTTLKFDFVLPKEDAADPAQSRCVCLRHLGADTPERQNAFREWCAANGHNADVRLLPEYDAAVASFASTGEAAAFMQSLKGKGEGEDADFPMVKATPATKTVRFGGVTATTAEQQQAFRGLCEWCGGAVQSVEFQPNGEVVVSFLSEVEAASCASALQGKAFQDSTLKADFGCTDEPAPQPQQAAASKSFLLCNAKTGTPQQQQELQDLCQKYGHVQNLKFLDGCALVEFTSGEEAAAFENGLDNWRSLPAKISAPNSVLIDNVTAYTSEQRQQLHELCAQYGHIDAEHYIPASGGCRAEVMFSDGDAAAAAAAAACAAGLSGNEFAGKCVQAAVSAPEAKLLSRHVQINDYDTSTPEKRSALRQLCEQYGRVDRIQFRDDGAVVLSFTTEDDAVACMVGLRHIQKPLSLGNGLQVDFAQGPMAVASSVTRAGMHVHMENLKPGTTQEELEQTLGHYGKLVRCDLENGTAELDFENAADPEEAARALCDEACSPPLSSRATAGHATCPCRERTGSIGTAMESETSKMCGSPSVQSEPEQQEADSNTVEGSNAAGGGARRKNVLGWVRGKGGKKTEEKAEREGESKNKSRCESKIDGEQQKRTAEGGWAQVLQVGEQLETAEVLAVPAPLPNRKCGDCDILHFVVNHFYLPTRLSPAELAGVIEKRLQDGDIAIRYLTLALKNVAKLHEGNLRMSAHWLSVSIQLSSRLCDNLGLTAEVQEDGNRMYAMHSDAPAVRMRSAQRALYDEVRAAAAQAFDSFVSTVTTALKPLVLRAAYGHSAVHATTSGQQRTTAHADNSAITLITARLSEMQHFLDDAGVPAPVRLQAVCQVAYWINALIFNSLEEQPSLCTCGSGLGIKLAVSEMEAFLAGTPSTMPAMKFLGHAREASNLLVMDKSILLDSASVASVFACLSTTQMFFLVSHFQPDSYSPEPIPNTIISAVKGYAGDLHVRLDETHHVVPSV
eukprot:TRINITY_DN1190_c0_g1_i5.p1 TRINITY_DN1190_c0_g1~~TRINITY_DN1190_c0_g1_i5.p1  ORF type:complete len:1437 (-),score=320.67 TRINITY_DN1190_c0_g1_i5:63-4130(-)